MRICNKIYPALFLLTCLFASLGNSAVYGQDVLRASGATNISIDNVGTGAYTSVSGPTIRETASGQLAENGTIVLTLPNGYEWNTNAAVILEEAVPVGANKTELTINLESITAENITFTVESSSRTAGNGHGPGRVTISGLQLRPTNTIVPNVGQISNTGTTGPLEANYGDLSTKAGVIADVRVETKADGTGDLVSDQDLTAGTQLEVFAIARDGAGNYIENLALNSAEDWSLENVTGGILQTDLQPSSNRRRAVLTAEKTGSVNIRAELEGVNSTFSGTITVLPAEAYSIAVDTQPPDTAIAGNAFDPQPVLTLYDYFGNVANNTPTDVVTSLASGNGSLSGELTQQTENGMATFDGLSADMANTITLQFESAGLDPVVSNDIEVIPNAPYTLKYREQPTNTLPGNTIEPPVEIQLYDEYSNIAKGSSIEVTLTEESGSFLNGSVTVFTNSDGIAIFDDLQINDTTVPAEVSLSAAFQNINASVLSETFKILNSGELAGFVIEAVGGGDIGDQAAGKPFDIQISAVDGSGSTYTNYTDAVDLISESEFLDGGGTTVNFTDGFLSSHLVTLETAGEIKLYAENSNDNLSGQSNIFNIQPAELDTVESSIEANLLEITADGVSTSMITVRTKDEHGNQLVNGGQTIQVVTDNGTFGNNQATVTATDQNDGTYTASLTSSNQIETATVEAYLNGVNYIDEISVDFIAGEVATLVVEVPQENDEPQVQTAGEWFDISIEARDDNNNLVEGFSGSIVFSANSEILDGTSATMSNGIITHPIKLSKTGSEVNITATHDSFGGATGTSENFTIVANEPTHSNSELTARPHLLLNDAESQSEISVILRDEFGNLVKEQYAVSLAMEQLELDGENPSGSPVATLGNIEFDPATGLYRAGLNSTTTIELVELRASFEGGPDSIVNTEVGQIATVNIVVPNTWTAGAGGPPANRIDWSNGENWSLDREPEENDFVIIPGDLGDSYPELDLNISVGGLTIENNGQLVLFGGNAISVAGNTKVDGTLNIENNTDLSINGNFSGTGSFAAGESVIVEIFGDVNIQSFLARTTGSIIRLFGDQLLTGNMLAERLEIRNDILVSSTLTDVDVLDISSENTFELNEDQNATLDVTGEIVGGGFLILNNNTLILRGNIDLETLDASEATINFSGSSQQHIANLSQMKNAVINNSANVRTYEDVIVDGNLTLENGQLIISSGKSLIAPNISYTNGSVQFLRSISNVKGWRMLTSPVGTSYDNLFNGLTVQGLTGGVFNDRQPNLLYYDESFESADNHTAANQRWRNPETVGDMMVPGRGYFFYVFGDPEDEDYNDVLPHTLTGNGELNIPSGDFSFGVSYTDYPENEENEQIMTDSERGWNLLGNPFGATIDWGDEGSWTKANLDETMYVWDSNANNGDGEYRVFNSVTGHEHTGKIPPFQAFWVKANGEGDPDLTVNNSAKTTGGVFYKMQGQSKQETADASLPIVTLQLKKEDTDMESSTFFMFSEYAMKSKDSYDAYRLESMGETYLEIYSVLDNNSQLVINNLPKRSVHPYDIPIGVGGFIKGESAGGEYTMSWPQMDDVPDSWILEIIDKEKDITMDMTEVDSYSFQLAGNQPSLNAMQKYSEPSPQVMKSSAGTQDRFVFKVRPDMPNDSDIPEEFALEQNYPNPFNPQTIIQFALPEASFVRLQVYNILGREVASLAAEDFEPGYHKVNWDASQSASGMYIYRIQAGNNVMTKKMTLIK